MCCYMYSIVRYFISSMSNIWYMLSLLENVARKKKSIRENKKTNKRKRYERREKQKNRNKKSEKLKDEK